MTLRILCIHGYRQTGAIFREKSGAFRKILKNICDFVFIDAPLSIPSDNGNTSDGLGWWFSRDDNSFDATEKTDFLFGFDESVNVVKQALRTQGPFDGILAFSQGAAFITLIQILMEQYPEKWEAPTVRFCILFATFHSRSSLHSHFYGTPIKMPTLIVYGEQDKVIPRDMTEALLPMYTGSGTTLLHPGGHLIPTNSTAKEAYRNFIAKFIN